MLMHWICYLQLWWCLHAWAVTNWCSKFIFHLQLLWNFIHLKVV